MKPWSWLLFICLNIGTVQITVVGQPEKVSIDKQRQQKVQKFISDIDLNSDKPDAALLIAYRFLDFARQLKDPEIIALAGNKLVKLLRSKGDWIGLIREGNLLNEELKGKLENYYKLAQIIDESLYGYIFLGDNKTVQEFVNKSISNFRKLPSSNVNLFTISSLYLSSARSYGYVKDYENSAIALDSSLYYIKKLGDINAEHVLSVDIISNRLDRHLYQEALPLAIENQAFFQSHPFDERAASENEMLLGKIMLAMGRVNEAIEASNRSLKTPLNLRLRASAYETLYKAYKELGKAPKALESYEQFIKYRENLFNEKLANEKAALEKGYAEENSRILFEAEKDKFDNQVLLSRTFIVSAIILLLLTIFLLRGRRILNRRNKEIESQKQVIEHLNSDLERKVKERTQELQRALDEIKEAMQKGQTMERKRMAADLHDNLGSMLTAINLSLDMINSESLTEKERAVYERTLKMTEEAYSQVRLLSHNLMPEVLEKEGLAVALHELVDRLNYTQVIHFSLQTPDLGEIPKNIAFTLYVIILEIVQNILKHSGANESEIILRANKESFILEVSDNGKGASLHQLDGFGLRNIKKRIEELKGELQVDHSASQGLSLFISIPSTI